MDATLPATDQLYESAACALVATDTGGLVLQANATFHEWLGVAAGTLVGRVRMGDLLPPGARLFFRTRCDPLLETKGAVAEIQVDLLAHDGSRLPVLLNIVRRRPADATDGPAIDHWALFRSHERHAYEYALLAARRAAEHALDAQRETDLRLEELNAQLSQADRRKDEFLATLSHELRNPLAPMRSALDVIRLRHGGQEDARLMQAFDRQLRHLTRLVDDLMDVSRITQDRMQLRRAPLDLCALVRAAAQDMAPAMAAARHTVRLAVPAGPLVVDGDATRLAQVLINLLGNAAKYTPDGGRIEVALGCADGQAELRVRDNGIGIAPGALPTVFEMFAQLDAGLQRARGGLGIGLALARGIVGLHGGTLDAASPGTGLGSEFTLRLPLAGACPAPEDAPAEAALPSTLRVLVVDDNADAAETMALSLELFGCETRTAYTAAGALELACEFEPDVAVLDIGLPDWNGYELARRLRLLPRGLGMTLVAATGWGQDKDRQLAFDAGFDHHLTKPVDVERLRLLLAQ